MQPIPESTWCHPQPPLESPLRLLGRSGQLHRLHACRLGSPCGDCLPFLCPPGPAPIHFTIIFAAGKRISEVGAQTLKVALSSDCSDSESWIHLAARSAQSWEERALHCFWRPLMSLNSTLLARRLGLPQDADLPKLVPKFMQTLMPLPQRSRNTPISMRHDLWTRNNSGQSCNALSRMLVPRSRPDPKRPHCSSWCNETATEGYDEAVGIAKQAHAANTSGSRSVT